MNLYDDLISQINCLCSSKKKKEVMDSKIKSVTNNMVFQSDVAYELGGSKLPSISLTLPSSTIDIQDSIYVLGKDLQSIHKDNPLARISIVKIKETEKTADALYAMIKRLDFTKYHVNPEGYMMRISSMLDVEPVRISKKALNNNITFQDVGNHFIQAFHKHKEVLAVQQIFITDPNFDYELLKSLAKQAKERTNLIDHMVKDLSMNCGACHLKPVCDEVEGMKELHEQSSH